MVYDFEDIPYTGVREYYSYSFKKTMNAVYRIRHKITHPLAYFSKLGYSTARTLPVPKSVPLERSRRELSENVSFGFVLTLVAEQTSFEK